MGLEHIHGIPKRIADLKRKLAARERSPMEFHENIPAIKTEIARLEALTLNPVASTDDQQDTK